MKVLCFSISLLLYIFELICSHHLNVGTVLFTKADLCRKCWSESERTLLIARQVMQGVLPDPEFMDITKTGTLTVVLEYFQSCFEVIGQSTCGKTQHLMFLALSDALGGYLRSYILPITRQAYYAGHIKYLEASKIFQFYDEIRDFLKTNGAGWAKPRRFGISCKIRPLKITTKGCDVACSQLYLKEEMKVTVCAYNKEGNTTEMKNTNYIINTTQQPPAPFKPPPTLLGRYLEGDVGVRHKLIDIIRGVKNQKYAENNPSGDDESHIPRRISLSGRNVQKIEQIRNDAKRLKDRLLWSQLYPSYHRYNQSVGINRSSPMRMLRHQKILRKREDDCKEQRPSSCNCGRELIIPLPVLDDSEKPHAIGLPFKVRPLRSLESPHAVCILVRYYITVIKCLVTKSNDRCDVFNFNGQFESWLTSHVQYKIVKSASGIFPHLNDEEWYPAFGGVLRIVETIKDIGCDECAKGHSNPPNDIGFMFSKGFAFDESDYLKNDECSECEAVACHRTEERTYLTLGILAIVTMWIMAFCYCICCYCPAVKTYDDDICAEDDADKRRATDPSNSFIVQCLIKFFKRAVEEDKKFADPGRREEREEDSYEYQKEESEVELMNRHLSPVDNQRRGNQESSRRAESREGKRKSGHGRETIVLPARVSPVNVDLPLGLTSFWPLAPDFRNDAEVKPHTECAVKPPQEKDLPAKSPRRDKEQFKTIWKREKSPETSESCSENAVKNGQATYRNEGNVKDRAKDKVKVQREVSSKSSYSDNSNSEDDNRKRIMFVRRSRPRFNYPCSYRYSYNSSPNSYSSSQMDDDITMEFYDHIVACHNSFARRPRPDHRREPKSESDSKRGLTSTTTSDDSSSEKCGRK